MKNFTIRQIFTDEIEKEIENVGFEKSYIQTAANKYQHVNLKIYDLTLPQANILKQTALSYGGDCAIHKDVLINNIEKTDCILSGTKAQIKKIAQSLKNQQFSLNNLSEKLENIIEDKKTNTRLVGILNLTTNSFSDGGKYLEYENAIKHLEELIQNGADIIDIGAESTKPFSSPVDADVQIERILPILNYVKDNNITVPISIDTRSSKVAKVCIENGATIINDVSGFNYDEIMIEVIKNSDAKIVIQHSKETPETMQLNPTYKNIIDDIFKELEAKIELAESHNISKNRIILDVGIGFGKNVQDNYTLMKHIKEFKSLGTEIMIGISRKSFLELESIEEKDIYTTALSSLLIANEVDYLRVHNVKMHKELLNIMEHFKN